MQIQKVLLVKCDSGSLAASLCPLAGSWTLVDSVRSRLVEFIVSNGAPAVQHKSKAFLAARTDSRYQLFGVLSLLMNAGNIEREILKE